MSEQDRDQLTSLDFPISEIRLGDIWDWTGSKALAVSISHPYDKWVVVWLRLNDLSLSEQVYGGNHVYVKEDTILIRDGERIRVFDLAKNLDINKR